MENMLIVLESVGSVLDTNNMCVYPQNADGSYDEEFSISIDEIEVTGDWWNNLSVEDLDTVMLYIRIIK